MNQFITSQFIANMMDLSTISAIDQHAHNVIKADAFDLYPYAAAFTEGHDEAIVNHHARHTLCYRRSLRDLAALLDCEPIESAICDRRDRLGLEKLTQLCFDAANLDAILLDDGFLPDEILPLEWHQQFIPVCRLLRLEMVAQNLIPQVRSFDELVERFCAELDPPPPGVVGFKSIAAYRTGLEIQPISAEVAKSNFNAIAEINAGKPPRLNDKSLIDFLIIQGLEIAAKHELPVQFHTGFGDPDLDLRLGNPLHLRFLLEDSRFRNVPFVLLHASYPFSREASYLASVYSQVYLDFGLAIPYLSVSGMRSTIQMLLELAPTSKIMYSSDAHLIPELYYLGAKWGRKILAEVLEEAIRDSDVSVTEAEDISVAILRENARNLYRLNLL